MVIKALCHFRAHAGGRHAGGGVTKAISPRGSLGKLLLTMKLTGILLLAAVVHVSARSTAQTVTYSARTIPLVSVFAAIEQQTGYVFFYNSRDLQGAGPVTVHLEKTPLKEALELVLAGQPVTFDIQGNTIAITRKVKSADVGVNTNKEGPPAGEIHGHITDSLGNPLGDASVSVKGSRKGTSTDIRGNFELKGVDANATVLISFTGFETQEIKLNGRNELKVVLKQSTSKLDETVVKGYYNTTERLNTGNVTTVKGETIQQQPVSDPILALEGRVPGLYIQQASGIPGAYSVIRIRGQNSIANGNSPLYIVDGVPYSATSLSNSAIPQGALGTSTNSLNFGSGASPFDYLNPGDIESIEVLKDADATAIYGSRGANGVILITTKKGKSGHTQFDLNAYSGAGKVTRMLNLLNTPEYLAMRHEALNNDGLTVSPYNYDINGVWDTTRYTNWQKVLIGNAARFSNLQGNLTGGDAHTQFIIGAGYSNQGTVYPGSYADQKGSIHLSLTHSSSDQRLHVLLTASYVNDNSDIPQSDFTSSITMAPDAPALYGSNGNLNWQPVNGGATWGNPLGATLKKAKATTDNLISNLNLSYLILPGLQLRSAFGFSHTQMNQSNLTPAIADPPPYSDDPIARENDIATNDVKTWIIEPQLDYQKKISHGQLAFLAGGTFQQNVQNSIAYLNNGFASDALLSDPEAASTRTLAQYSNTLYHYDAVFGRLGYNWEDKYLINITARRDGSSRFGPGKQFGNFGAIGAGWIFSREKPIQDGLSFLSFGKLRGSYGSTGNDQITDYQFLSTYSPSAYTYEGVTSLYPTGIANPYFSWELVKKLEGAIELGFLKDRLMITASYYRDRTGNQLVGYQLPILAGFYSIRANLPAVLQNSGTEFVLNTVNVKSKNFTWNTSINLTIPRNKLVAYPGLANSPYANAYVIGKSIFTEQVFHYVGVSEATGVYQYASKGGATDNPSAPGDFVTSKPVTQNYYGGIQNSLHYKGFQLDIFFQFVKQYSQNYFAYSGYGVGVFNTNFPKAVLSRWQKPGDVTKYGQFSTQNGADPNYDLQSSDFVLGDASFIRLKNLALSYQLPLGWRKKAYLQTARIYLQCQNLFTITKYLGLDPETGAGLGLPPLRMITGGIQIGL
jgi:TonB-dependent starch-binding outer membrane protein SusC